jgi:hypothetical protein
MSGERGVPLGDELCTRNVLESLKWKNPLGRSSILEDSIKIDLHKMVWISVEWAHLSEDENRWGLF